MADGIWPSRQEDDQQLGTWRVKRIEKELGDLCKGDALLYNKLSRDIILQVHEGIFTNAKFK
jgi:hypothetical protein